MAIFKILKLGVFKEERTGFCVPRLCLFSGQAWLQQFKIERSVMKHLGSYENVRLVENFVLWVNDLGIRKQGLMVR